MKYWLKSYKLPPFKVENKDTHYLSLSVNASKE